MRGLEVEEKNRAKDIIEDFMIAANGVTARFLAAKGSPPSAGWCARPSAGTASSRSPPSTASQLPGEPDPGRWRSSSRKAQANDPLRFPDLSLAVIKLLGPGEYVAELPGEHAAGPLRPGRQGLRPFHGAQPALHRPGHPAPAQGGPGRAAGSLRRATS